MKLYIINLPQATERKALMAKQFANLDSKLKEQYEIIFFNAINAQAKEHLAFKQYSKTKSLLFRGKELSDGERACFASHYTLWQKCIESNEPIIVLEDDVEILPHFWQELERIKQSEYVYVRLMYLATKAKFYDLQKGFYFTFNNVSGAQGYYLTPQAARAFIESATSWYRPVDDYMDMFYRHKVPIVCCEPVLKENGMGSTISGRWQKPPLYLKVIREGVRFYLQLQKVYFLLFSQKSFMLPQASLHALASKTRAYTMFCKQQAVKLYIINLPQATERKALMTKQFENLDSKLKEKYEIIFFNAINAQAKEHLDFKQYSKIKSLLFRGKELSNGERACFASHYTLWQKCIESNEPIIVLEDDVEILPHFWQELERIEQSEFAYVRLRYTNQKAVFYSLEHNFYISFDNVAGTQGYYLTPTAAKAFIESAKSWYRPVDDYMDMFYLHRIPIVCVKPLLHSVDIQSIIGGREQKPSLFLKIVRECVRLLFQTRRFVFLSFFKSTLLLPKESLQKIRWGGGC